MKAVDSGTKFIRDRMIENVKARRRAGEPVPFDEIEATRVRLGVEWATSEKDVAAAKEALAVWAKMVVASCLMAASKELVQAGRTLEKMPRTKPLADQLRMSLPLINAALTAFLETGVDFEYVAEELFEEGLAATAEQGGESAKPENEGEKPDGGGDCWPKFSNN